MVIGQVQQARVDETADLALVLESAKVLLCQDHLSKVLEILAGRRCDDDIVRAFAGDLDGYGACSCRYLGFLFLRDSSSSSLATSTSSIVMTASASSIAMSSPSSAKAPLAILVWPAKVASAAFASFSPSSSSSIR